MFFSLATFTTFGQQMRVALFFVYFFLNFLTTGDHVKAISPVVDRYNIAKCNSISFEQVKFVRASDGSVVANNVDFDFEEECSSGDSVKKTDANKSLTGKYVLLKVWYLRSVDQLAVNCCSQNPSTSSPPYGKSNPIYITQRVLRI